MTHSVEADISIRKPRERELYTIPISSSWFRWEDIHELERRSLPEFFDGGSYSRSPRVYKEYRDFIINKYREDPSRRLTFTDVRKCLIGDVCTIRKVFIFLIKWGLINFSASDGKQERQQHSEDDGPLVVVEEGPAVGVSVQPAPSSSSSFASMAQAGEEGLFSLPPLSSYSDAFWEWNFNVDLICGLCGSNYRSKLNESLKGGITMCSKCLSKVDTGNEKSEVNLTQNNNTDANEHSSAAWTDAETLLLLEAVLKHGDDWDLIAQHVRTKETVDCISKLIHLPFEIDGNKQVEINKGRDDERDGQNDTLNQRCFPPFIHTTDSFMKQIASLSTVCGPHVANAAMDAAVRALCLENPCARLAFETNGDKIAKPVSPVHENEFKCDVIFEDEDAKRNKHPGFVSKKNFGTATFQLRATIATSLATAASRAKLVADQEEREMQLLISSIIQAQIKKLQYKMKHLEEIELIMGKEFVCTEQVKENIMEEWVNVLKKIFHARIPRWRELLFSKTFLHTLPL